MPRQPLTLEDTKTCGDRSPPAPHNATSLSLLEQLGDATNDEAWEQFQSIYRPMLRSWLVRRGVKPNDAEDLQQEVMQMAVVELKNFKHNGRVGALRNWLRRVMANRLKTFYRQNNRQGVAMGGSDYVELANQLQDPNSDLSRIWDAEYHAVMCVRLMLLVQTEFTEKTMQAFRRVTMEDGKTADVAEQLGMSPNAVRIAQSRVMRRLRELGKGMLEQS